MKIRTFFTIILIAHVFIGHSQTYQDSMFAIWEDELVEDSIRVDAFSNYLRVAYMLSDPKQVLQSSDTLLLFESDSYAEGVQAARYYLRGLAMYMLSSYRDALDQCVKSIAIYENLGDLRNLAKAYNLMGGIFKEHEDIPRALKYFHMHMDIMTRLGDGEGISNGLTSIGTIYLYQGDHAKALEYFFRSVEKREGITTLQGNSTNYANIGLTYRLMEDNEQSLKFLEMSLAEYRGLQDYYGIGSISGLIGEVYKTTGDYDRALKYMNNGKRILDSINSPEGRAYIYGAIGGLYNDQKKYVEAIDYCMKGYLLGLELDNSLDFQKSHCRCLYEAYRASGDKDSALEYLVKLQAVDSSIGAKETTLKLQQMAFARQVYADSVENAEEARLVQEAHDAEVLRKNRARNVATGGGLFALLLAGGFYSRSRYISKSRDIIAKEKNRSDNLLLNILPAEIAVELKENGEATARDYQEVSILFTDFKQFTKLSEQLSAKELVAELNYCFKAFDAICEKHGIEKIKTLGDSYMATGGLPVPREDSANRLVLTALEMQDMVLRRAQERRGDNSIAFEMRAGIHTGPVVAGIVGVKKFQYDIWGDTVNTASRMESNGEVGKVNISQTTYELIKDDPQFTFEHRGKIEAKGKGEVDMYFVFLA